MSGWHSEEKPDLKSHDCRTFYISVGFGHFDTIYLEPDKEVEKLFKNTAMWSRVLEVGIVVYRIFIKPGVIEIL